MPKKYTIDFDSPKELHEILKSINSIMIDNLREKIGIPGLIELAKYNTYDTSSIGGTLILDTAQLSDAKIAILTQHNFNELTNEQYKTLGVRINDEKE